MTIYKGKTTEDAIEKGLKDLALDKNKVKIEVKTSRKYWSLWFICQ